MRAIVLFAAVLVVVSARSAKADSFLDIMGGISTPVGDDDWKNQVETSPKLAVRGGSVPNNIGGMVSVDWTPENTDTMSQTFPGGSQDVSAHRFRMLASAVVSSPVKAKLLISARAGVGIDIAHASYTLNVGPFSGESKDTDVGFAFEAGAGIWFKLGSVALGGELAVPISSHDHKASKTGEITFQYTSYDVDLLFGVRLLGGHD